jgi:hypothetical protein
VKLVAVVTLVLAAVAALAFGAFGGIAPRRGEPTPAAGRVRGPDLATLDAAIARGVAHLVASAEPSARGAPASNLWDIYAPVPGSYYAFEVAVTALAVSGLREAAPDDPKARAAGDRGLDFLLREHTKARRISPDVLYNVWAHAYALDALRSSPAAPSCAPASPRPRRSRSSSCAASSSWTGAGATTTSTSSPGSPSTGPRASPRHRAAGDEARRRQGVESPRVVRRALDFLATIRKPDGAFAYWDHRYYPQGGINHTQGSLARTPVALGAIRRFGGDVPQRQFVKALDDLHEKGRFLLIARKYPIPHETWFQNSGYFCFYGYYYATGLFAHVPAGVAEVHRKSIATALAPLQEEDGSFWDYQLYGYHKAYGTGYVLLALARCRAYR